MRVVIVKFVELAVKVNVPFPVAPEFTVSQLWLEVAVQVELDDTFTVALLLAVFATLAVAAETDNVASPTACVTVTT